MAATDLLAAAYAPLLTLSDHLATTADDALGWTPTALPGWTVRDLVFHLAGDAQRALVALHTPTDEAADTDAASYWSTWTPSPPGADPGRRATRAIASQWSSVRGPADLYRETARAVLHAAAGAGGTTTVRTQDHVVTVDDLLSTLVVEAAVHTLDLDASVPGGPAAGPLAEVRRVTAVLLGDAPPREVDDARWARLAAGRVTPTPAEATTLGPAAARLPLFG